MPRPPIPVIAPQDIQTIPDGAPQQEEDEYGEETFFETNVKMVAEKIDVQKIQKFNKNVHGPLIKNVILGDENFKKIILAKEDTNKVKHRK